MGAALLLGTFAIVSTAGMLMAAIAARRQPAGNAALLPGTSALVKDHSGTLHIGARIVAYVVDNTLLFVPAIAAGILGTATPGWALLLVAWTCYMVATHAIWGRSAGKAVLGLRVVNATTHLPPSLGRAVIRELRDVVPTVYWCVAAAYPSFRSHDGITLIFAGVVLTFLVVDFVTLMATRGRALHDWIAGTAVVPTRR